MKNFWLVALLGVLSAADLARADLVYGNFTNDVSDPVISYGILWRHDSTPASRGISTRFTVPTGTNYQLESLTLALNKFEAPVNLEILLLADNGNAPGSILETLAVNPAGLGYSQPPVPSTFISSLQPVLNGGSAYWILVQPHDRNVADASQNSGYDWHRSYDTLAGPMGFRNYNYEANDWGAWQTFNSVQPAFRVEGFVTAVPEPRTWALLGLGGALLWSATRHRRK